MKDISTDDLKTATIILTLIWATVFTPISLYYARSLWILKQQNVIYVNKRHPKVVILSIILLNIYPTIIRPVQELCIIYYGDTFTIWAIALANSMQYCVGILCVRLWLLFYDYTYELHSLSLKWKSHLSDSLHIPWTIRHRWLGNAKIIVAIPLILTSLILFIIGYVRVRVECTLSIFLPLHVSVYMIII